jgi:hypothetical protein
VHNLDYTSPIVHIGGPCHGTWRAYDGEHPRIDVAVQFSEDHRKLYKEFNRLPSAESIRLNITHYILTPVYLSGGNISFQAYVYRWHQTSEPECAALALGLILGKAFFQNARGAK